MKQFLQSTNLLLTVVDETKKNSGEASELVTGLSEEQLNWKPAADRWSIAQCLYHLTVSTEKFGSYFTAAIALGRNKYPITAPPVYRPSWMGGWLIRQLLPEVTRKMTAPKIFRPSHSETFHHSLDHFLKQQEHFLDFVRQAEGLDYNKTRLRSPVTPLVRYSLADAFVLIAVHGQRHLGQARRVRETPAFPV